MPRHYRDDMIILDVLDIQNDIGKYREDCPCNFCEDMRWLASNSRSYDETQIQLETFLARFPAWAQLILNYVRHEACTRGQKVCFHILADLFDPAHDPLVGDALPTVDMIPPGFVDKVVWLDMRLRNEIYRRKYKASEHVYAQLAELRMVLRAYILHYQPERQFLSPERQFLSEE